MNHFSEEQLVLHYYGESEESASIEQHLGDCVACRAQYQAIEEVLAAASTLQVPERDETYGRRVWERVQWELKHPRPLPQPGLSRLSSGWLPRWALAGAAAALVLLSFLAGTWWKRDPQMGNRDAAPGVERIVLVNVGEHLERSQMILVELTNAASASDLDAAMLRSSEDLLAANRLFRQTATQAGESGVAGVLEELERILMEVANNPSELSADQLEQLRERIESRGLLFKVRVVGSQLRQRAIPPSTNQTTTQTL
ncbi:MAG: hypothetical protein ACR2L2_02825 [Acidobacteriota bacterium]